MPSTRTICYYAMYVIGEVESRWDWTAVNYADPITIGMMQWYGTRAAALLNRVKNEMPSAYNTLAASLRASVETYPQDSQYWTSRYLTNEEGNSVITVFTENANHVIQENQAIADFEGYISLLESWGMSQANPKPLIFAMSMYHQSPRQAGYVIGSCGGSADLDRVYSTCLNDAVLSQYYNRYNTIYNRLAAWDGTSEPPDFGQVGNTPGAGGNVPPVSEIPSHLGYIIQQGDNLVLFGEGDYAGGVTFYKTNGQTWVNGYNADGTPPSGGNTGGGDDPRGVAAVKWMTDNLERWQYGNGAGRLDPESSGYTDCSGGVWCAYWFGCGIEVGSPYPWTGTQSQAGREIWRGYSLDDVPWDEVRAGDIMLMASSPDYLWNFDGYLCDVQLCTGEPYETVGCGYAPLPRYLRGSQIDVYNGSAGFMIRRVVE